ncbi:hypothetical protein P0D88_54280, partial [Paraburkholderia sp. RL18-103-BIB-C]|uniref:hypothetical protein n=1 Tax=Paraburkholderia sp. RL18-103-BIB-C TaxID=3031637 RepID=UPI0038BDB805
MQNHLNGRKANERSNTGACTFGRGVERHQLGRCSTSMPAARAVRGLAIFFIVWPKQSLVQPELYRDIVIATEPIEVMHMIKKGQMKDFGKVRL